MVTARDFKVGQKVRTKVTVKPKQYADRAGRVLVRKFDDHEIGLGFGKSQHAVWFRPDEIEGCGPDRTAYVAAIAPQTAER